jgi:arginine-tRNA-protein transferase
VVEDISSGEHYALYRKYIEQRHADGDMYPPSRQQYDSFLGSCWEVTHYIEYRLEGKLVGVAVTDGLDNGISAIYTFFDTDLEKRSLGVFSILLQIELAKKFEVPDLYLGYWIKNSPKMSYKNQYRPFELFTGNRWVRLT